MQDADKGADDKGDDGKVADDKDANPDANDDKSDNSKKRRRIGRKQSVPE